MKQLVVEQEVLKLARQAAGGLGIEVVGVSLLGGGNRKLLRVTIDREGGVTIGDCENLSRRLDPLLEAENAIKGSFSLEVSSPGLNRPLTTLADFERNIGKLVRVITDEKIDNRNFFLGRLTGVDGNIIRLSLDEKCMEIPFERISKARLEIEIK